MEKFATCPKERMLDKAVRNGARLFLSSFSKQSLPYINMVGNPQKASGIRLFDKKTGVSFSA